MLDLIMELLEFITDYYIIYKRNKADFLEGMKLEGISMLFLVAAVICAFAWKLWILAAAFLGGSVWFGLKWNDHVQECVRKERKY